MSLKIIAEAGSTHFGDVKAAMQAATAAKEASADAIKFIASNPEELLAQKDIKFEGKNLYDVIESYRFKDDNDWFKLADHCRKIGIEYFASVGTIDYFPIMEQIGISTCKIGGWDSRSFPLILAGIKTGLPIMIDIGAVISGEVDNILEFIYSHDKNAKVSLLYESHGTKEELNLLSISYLRKKYDIPIGFSSGDKDIRPDKIAILLGAEIIEKRLTPFTDTKGHHQDAALNPTEFKKWVAEIRKLEADRDNIKIEADEKPLLGREGLYPSLKDISSKNLYFTSLVYNRNMKKGEVIKREDLACRRPGNGWSAVYDYLVIGKALSIYVNRNEYVLPESVGEVGGPPIKDHERYKNA